MIIKRNTPLTPIQLTIVNLNRTIEVEGGVTLRQVADTLRDEIGFDPILAIVNNKNEGLHYQVYGPKRVEFMPRTSKPGIRVYNHSLCMMLYYAVSKAFTGASLNIEHWVSNGLYVRIPGVEPTEDNARVLKGVMRDLCRRHVDFVYHVTSTEQAIKVFENEGLCSKVLLLNTLDALDTNYYSLEDVADKYYGCLAPHTGMIDVFDLTVYNSKGFLLRSFDPEAPDRVPDIESQPMMYSAFEEHLEFNSIVGVSNAGELNNVVLHGRPADLINLAEALHNKYISNIADRIAARYRDGGARVVLIAGPSSSGKTTTTKRLAIQLMTNLLKPVMISLDDYFVERENTPRNETGDYDYESLYALDLELFNKDINRILAGEEVELPKYSFETGKRLYKGNRVRLEPGSILLIEGIHALNPELSTHIAENMKFRLYVSALTTLSIDNHNSIPTTDNRLLRRIVRDYKYRDTSAADTIKRWPSVRRGEEKWIYPNREYADAMFNSSLLFELAVIKDYAMDILDRVPATSPQYAQAYRLKRFLSYFRQISADAIPPTSLLREFLGGSSFKY